MDDPMGLDVQVTGYLQEKPCGHFGFGIEVDCCLTQEEAESASYRLREVMVTNMAFILGMGVTVDLHEGPRVVN